MHHMQYPAVDSMTGISLSVALNWTSITFADLGFESTGDFSTIHSLQLVPVSCQFLNLVVAVILFPKTCTCMSSYVQIADDPHITFTQSEWLHFLLSCSVYNIIQCTFCCSFNTKTIYNPVLLDIIHNHDDIWRND